VNIVGLVEILKRNLFPDMLTEQQMAGIMLDMRNCWEVTKIKGVQAANFFRTLVEMAPEYSIFCLETTAAVDEVKEFLEANKMPPVRKVQLGTLWPKPSVYHIPLNEQTMQQMAQLAVNFAMPEICDHIHIYNESLVLLEWFDAFWQPMYISKKIPENSIKSFCEKIGCDYCDGSLPSWPGPG